MKVFIVMEYGFEHSDILAIYDTEEKAKNHIVLNDLKETWRISYNIEEHEVK